MNPSLYESLSINHDETLRRFSGHEGIFLKFLKKFPDEPTFAELKTAAGENDFAKIETAAHTLKGIAGNLGITSVFDASSELVNAVRAKEYDKVPALFENLSQIYDNICNIIRQAEV